MVCFPIRHFAGNTECGGSNQVAVALVISIVPLVVENERWEQVCCLFGNYIESSVCTFSRRIRINRNEYLMSGYT